MSKSATLLGSSSGRNAGDAALISGIMDAVDRACGEPLTYEIPTPRASYIRENYLQHRTRPISMMPWHGSVKMLGLPTYASIRRTDVTLIFDAILFDRSLLNPLFNFMSSLYLMLPAAKRAGRKMACYNVGTGPVNTKLGRKMLRELADRMDFITVRDQDSFDVLQDIGVRNPRILITADAALNVPASDPAKADATLRQVGLDPEQEILGININAYIDTWAGPDITPMGREKFLSVYAAALNRALKDIDAQVLFVCTQHLDVEITRDLMSRVTVAKRKALVANMAHNHHDVKAVLGRLALLFGMRLHCMILASSELTPIIGLAYQPKIDHYYNTLGLSPWSLSFRDYSEEALVQHLTTGWAQRKAIKSQLVNRVPLLQREALKAAHLVSALLKGEDLDAAVNRLRAPAT